jgi:Cellulose binding domain
MAGATYYYRVEAVDAAGSSPPSSQASAATPPISGGFACHVAYANVNQWNAGFQAAITIQNTGTVGITNWTLRWTFPGNQQITNLWNGSYVQTGSTVTVTSLSYNGAIPAGHSYSGLGFTANFTGTNAVPASFSVNGVLCR